MKILLKANKNVLSLLNEQKFDNSKIYRKMHFIVCEKKDNENLLIFNNITKEVCQLTKEEAQAFNILDTNNETVITLIKNWYIVPQNFDEAKAFDQIRDLYLNIRSAKSEEDSFNTFTILPTTACNARCYYCYQEGCKNYTMDEKIAHDVANFIKNKISNKRVMLRWFGGEPLVAQDKIDIICKDLIDSGIEINSDIISNGYLFDTEIVNKAINLWNLSYAQITLDGTENIYNAVKNYKVSSHGSPFNRVIDNIETLLQNKVCVHIRLNLSDNNEDDIVKLIEFLSERYSDYKDLRNKAGLRLLTVYVYTIFQNMFDAEGSIDAENNLKKLYDREIKLSNMLKSNNLGTKVNLPKYIRLNHCMADNGCSAVILPDGGLTVCEHHVSGEANYGSIYSDKVDKFMLAKWKERWPKSEKCSICPCYPSCFRLKNCPNIKKKCSLAFQNFEIEKLHNALAWL